MDRLATLCVYVTGYWKSDQIVTLGLSYFIAPTINYIATLMHYPCTVPLQGIDNTGKIKWFRKKSDSGTGNVCEGFQNYLIIK